MSDPVTLQVPLGARSYDILIGPGLLGSAESFAPVIGGPAVLIVSNDVVAPLYLDTLRSALPGRDVATHILPDGERWKRLDQVAAIIDTAVDMRAGRDATIVALGGGVVGDMAGFAAACFMRGIPFVQVPTTLLAQVDSSVGGKTGVNHARGKNLIGAFHQPARVIIDIGTLSTLPAREYSAGLAEVIKYGLLGDAAFFATLERDIGRLMARDPGALIDSIARSCRAKAEIVAADELERGRRALLNLGHTFGHAIEACTGFGEWLHGEAVAAGMVMAAEMSGLPGADLERIRSLLSAAGLPTEPPPLAAADMLAAMRLDKKVAGGRVRLVLLRSIGDAVLRDDYDDERLLSVLERRVA